MGTAGVILVVVIFWESCWQLVYKDLGYVIQLFYIRDSFWGNVREEGKVLCIKLVILALCVIVKNRIYLNYLLFIQDLYIKNDIYVIIGGGKKVSYNIERYYDDNYINFLKRIEENV